MRFRAHGIELYSAIYSMQITLHYARLDICLIRYTYSIENVRGEYIEKIRQLDNILISSKVISLLSKKFEKLWWLASLRHRLIARRGELTTYHVMIISYNQYENDGPPYEWQCRPKFKRNEGENYDFDRVSTTCRLVKEDLRRIGNEKIARPLSQRPRRREWKVARPLVMAMMPREA